jgi:metal-responsive CopG/Arc/MetJ family transcriptional regulator
VLLPAVLPAVLPAATSPTLIGSMVGTISGMPKEKISVTVDAIVLAAVDADARAAGLNRSEMIEQALRNEHLRAALHSYATRTVPALNIDAYAKQVYQANRNTCW